LEEFKISTEEIDKTYGRNESVKFRQRFHERLGKCWLIVEPKIAQTKQSLKAPGTILAKGDGHAMKAQDPKWATTENHKWENTEQRHQAKKEWDENYKNEHGKAYKKARARECHKTKGDIKP
jgi:hypothetical protein